MAISPTGFVNANNGNMIDPQGWGLNPTNGAIAPAAFFPKSIPTGTADDSSPNAAPAQGSPLPKPTGPSNPVSQDVANGLTPPGMGSVDDMNKSLGGKQPMTSAQKGQIMQGLGQVAADVAKGMPKAPMVQANAPAASAPGIPNKTGEVGQLAAALSNPALAAGVKFGG